VSWLRRQQVVLGLTVDPDVDSVEQDGVPVVAAALVEVVRAREGTSDPKVTGNGPNSGDPSRSRGSGPAGSSPSRLTLAPLERLAVPHALCGADGESRSTAFCYIQAQHDLDVVQAYLNRYPDQSKNAAGVHQGARALPVAGGGVTRQGAERSARR
jgi:hypothetical protein